MPGIGETPICLGCAMPNWVSNHIQIVGEPEKVAAVIAEMDIKKNYHNAFLNFQKIRPCPQELLETSATIPYTPEQIVNFEKFGYHDWYEWCWANWGTKWSGDDASLEYVSGSTYADVYFNTAWCTPWHLLKFLSGKHPEVSFICLFSDMIVGWHGSYSLIAGELIRGFIEENIYEADEHFYYELEFGAEGCPVYTDGDVYP